MDSKKGENIEEMLKTSITTFLVKTVKDQGVSFLLLGLMVWYFHAQTTMLHTEIKECNNQQMEIYKSQNIKLMEVVDRNSKAFEAFSEQLNK